MKKKVLSFTLSSLVLLVSFFSNRLTVVAANSETNDLVKPGEAVLVEDIGMELDEIEENIVEHPYGGGELSVPPKKRIMAKREMAISNTDPNYAIFVTNEDVDQREIESPGEMRWYRFSLEQTSKVSILLQMVDSLDADIYVFKLNEETYQLEYLEGCARGGVGELEYYTSVLNQGIYFFAINGYESTGLYAFAFFQSTLDSNWEINDKASLATNFEIGDNTFAGILDTPSDIDFYKFSVTKPTLFNYTFLSENGYSFVYVGSQGDESGLFTIAGLGDNYKVAKPGTYYYAVYSENGAYSSENAYSLKFQKVSSLSGDSRANIWGISTEAGIVFETNETGTIYYVNGNNIDISYLYSQEINSSVGNQSYYITIQNSLVNRVDLSQSGLPRPVFYHSSTRPAMDVNKKPALKLTLYGEHDMYLVHCKCDGPFSMNNYWIDFGAVTVIVDPDTGKLIEISDFNYFYDFAPVGTNTITVLYPYRDFIWVQ
ncbi:MAG: hypothetical protein J5811_00065 [Lachnospiraceae bacterium]|nr:hypothetical protein [Lachnospiraceae bacterium]MBO4807709.1 hypothetical protein [Lachnospiraceae bacterium]